MKNECPKNENKCDSFMNKEWSKMNLCKTWRKCKCTNRMNKKILKIWQKIHGRRLFWKSSSRHALCWALYYVTSNKQVDLTPAQVMHCIFCYNYPDLNLNLKTQVRKKNHIQHNSWYNCIEKTCQSKSFHYYFLNEEEMNKL